VSIYSFIHHHHYTPVMSFIQDINCEKKKSFILLISCVLSSLPLTYMWIWVYCS